VMSSTFTVRHPQQVKIQKWAAVRCGRVRVKVICYLMNNSTSPAAT